MWLQKPDLQKQGAVRKSPIESQGDKWTVTFNQQCFTDEKMDGTRLISQ